MAKVRQVNQHSVITEVTEQSLNIIEHNGWKGLVSEIVSEHGVEGVALYFPGITYKDLLIEA